MFDEGDIVEIPLRDKQSAIARIIHISERTGGALGFVVLGIKGRAREDLVVDPRTGHPRKMKVLGPLYTDVSAAAHYGWTVIDHVPLSEQDKMMTKRRVGDGVYVRDQFIGSVAELGEQALKPMALCGMVAVHKMIENHFSF